MELRHLRYFIALAEELHFGRAARRMKLTQPPLSRQIRQLERELGVILFARTNKVVRLTEPGKILLQHARQLEESLAQAIKETRRAERGEVGRLAIAYVGAASYHVLPTLLRHFRAHYPHVQLVLYGMMTPEQLEAFSQGTIDIGIMRPTPGLKQLRSELVLREDFVVVLPEQHKFARQRNVHIRDLAQEDFVMLPSTPERDFHQVLDLCFRAQFHPRVVQNANETRSILGLVGAGIGISILPSSVQRMNISGVVCKPLCGVKSHADMVVVWRKDGETPVVKEFLEVLRGARSALQSTDRQRT